MEEIFKDIENYEGLYQISNFGRVYSLISKKFMSPVSNGNGYLSVNLSKNGKLKHCYIHRLVASTFIPNPSNLPQINHISEIKTENFVSNLEWCTPKYNCNYGSHTERIKQNPNWKKSREKSLKAASEKHFKKSSSIY